MARRLSKEDIIKAIDSDDSNEKLKETLGSDSGSDTNFLPYSSSDSYIELNKDQFSSTPNKSKNESQQIKPSKQFKMFSTNGTCISVHEGKKHHTCEKCNAKFVKKIELEKHFQSVHEGKKATQLLQM